MGARPAPAVHSRRYRPCLSLLPPAPASHPETIPA
jgi:hypothetical protein